MKGIDVSAHNGFINWNAVKAAGYDFVIIRTGYGNDISQKDRWFEQNIQGAHAADLKIGVYHFSYAISIEDARTEANLALQIIAPYRDWLTWPVFFDYEYDSVRWAKQNGVNPGPQLVTDMALTFLQTIAAAGYQAGNYTNLDYYRNWFQMERLKDYPMWFAQYEVDSPAVSCPLWQFGGENVPGCSGLIDSNIAFTDLSNGNPTQSEGAPASIIPVDVFHRVQTAEDGWLAEVHNFDDYAGIRGHKIIGWAIRTSHGYMRYRVHILGKDWLEWVDTRDGYNLSDINGYAGNGEQIDAIEAYFVTPDGEPYQYAHYKVSPNLQSYYPEQIDDQADSGMDGYAGVFGNTIDRVQLEVE